MLAALLSVAAAGLVAGAVLGALITHIRAARRIETLHVELTAAGCGSSRACCRIPTA